MKKAIFSVGFEFPGEVAENIAYSSSQSLLDADIIVFEPNIDCYSSYESYNGKPLLGESESSMLPKDTHHWKRELEIALESGKTIFFFLGELKNVFIYTGEKRFSGTGRSRTATKIVGPFDNYRVLPIEIGEIIPKAGNVIKPVKDLGFLASYWREFKPYSCYELYLECEMEKSVLSTKIGNKTVGAVHNVNNGTILFLPPVRFEGDEFISFDEESGEEYWTNKAIDFSQRLSSALMEIDNALRKRRSKTPEPLWVKAKAYQFRSEIIAKKNLAKLDERFETLQLTKAELLAHLEKEGNLRALLYEKGYPLENAILEVLNLIGYKAEKYQNGESEFDVVFIDEGIRFLGEVEGRDSQPINIEKLSQLERNIQEDFAREEVEDYAKGVLFGNAYRLIPPEEREDFFTTKCLSGAKRSKISLVRTPDLFRIAKYIKEYGNMSLAKECRKAIESAKGTIAKFPSLPKKSKGKRE